MKEREREKRESDISDKSWSITVNNYHPFLSLSFHRLRSPERVALNTWHMVRVRRKKRRGILQLNRGKKVRGKSGPRLTELNLNQPLFLGGLE